MTAAQVNVVNALQGKVAGVNITNASGGAGASVNINIRGITSFQEVISHCLLLTVIPISDHVDRKPPVAALGARWAIISHLNRALDLDMNNIESINILKAACRFMYYMVSPGCRRRYY